MPGPMVAVLVALAVATATLVLVNVASVAYDRLGLDGWWASAVLLASILGSWCNVPIARLHGATTIQATVVRAYGVLWVIPRAVRGTRILAVNVGGAFIPTVLSIYLIVHEDLGWRAVAAVVVVASATHCVARLVPGVGIVVPTVVPPIAAVAAAWIFAGGETTAALAYVAGTLGTLIGGDLLNLRRVLQLDAPVLSIGGAGTFDGIFVTGILAVLLAAI